jgi:hypothetical protein
MKLRLMLLLCAMLALSVGVATATAGGGASDAAKACQNGGWQHLYRSDGSSFNNQGDCVSYAAQGGTLTAKPQSQLDCASADGVYFSDSTGWSCGNYLFAAAGAGQLFADCLAEFPGGHFTVGVPNAGTGRTSVFACGAA